MTHTCHEFDPANPPPLWVQDGGKVEWSDELWRWVRVPLMEQIQPEWLDLPCQYTRRSIDKDCDHCERRNT